MKWRFCAPDSKEKGMIYPRRQAWDLGTFPQGIWRAWRSGLKWLKWGDIFAGTSLRICVALLDLQLLCPLSSFSIASVSSRFQFFPISDSAQQRMDLARAQWWSLISPFFTSRWSIQLPLKRPLCPATTLAIVSTVPVQYDLSTFCTPALCDDMTDLSMGRWVGCAALSPSSCCGDLDKASL